MSKSSNDQRNESSNIEEKKNFRMLQGRIESKGSMRSDEGTAKEPDPDYEFRMRNRRAGDDALSTTLSAFYAKFLVILGVAFPVTDILSQKAPPSFYQGFYLYLYCGSVAFVVYMYAGHLRTRALFSMIDSYRKKFFLLMKV